MDWMDATMSPTQAARALGVTVGWIRQLVRRGELAAIETPNGKLLRKADIRRMAQERAKRLAKTA